MNEQTTELEARSIHGDNGTYVLAPDPEAAQAFAGAEGYELGREVGWMVETGWNMDEYGSREQFEAESGFLSWWAGCRPPADGSPTMHLLRAWEATAA